MKLSLPLKLGIFVVLLFSAALSSGCVYMQNRALDFADCFKADIGIGYGLSAHVIAGPLGIGVGGSNCNITGINGRDISYMNREISWIPISNLKFFMLAGVLSGGRANLCCACTATLDMDGDEERTYAPILIHKSIDQKKAKWLTYGEISAGTTLLCVSVDIGFNLFEFGDFLAGWATIDFAEDDIIIDENKTEPEVRIIKHVDPNRDVKAERRKILEDMNEKLKPEEKE